MSFEKGKSGAPTLCTSGEGHTGGSDTREFSLRPCVVDDPMQVEKLQVREPGDLRSV
ncbi:MAG TPA: hypothetical protein VMY18_08750 [Acidobacteriota bacterium]|nr:hypothetical protein [Acidobacteriota bacterium]